jgi:hypothetical protein
MFENALKICAVVSAVAFTTMMVTLAIRTVTVYFTGS